MGVQELVQKNVNFVVNFRRVTHFWLCLLETQVFVYVEAKNPIQPLKVCGL